MPIGSSSFAVRRVGVGSRRRASRRRLLNNPPPATTWSSPTAGSWIPSPAWTPFAMSASAVGPSRRSPRRPGRRPGHRRRPSRRRARVRGPARAWAAGRVVSHDGARRRHLGVRARSGHRQCRRVVRGARGRTDRELRRVDRAHPGANEGPGGPGKGLLPAGIGGSGTASDAQMAAMESILREGLAQGAVAMGFGSAYTPGAPMSEIERMFRVAAEGGVSRTFTCGAGWAGCTKRSRRRRRARAAAHRARQLVGRRRDRRVPRRDHRRRATPGRTSRPKRIRTGPG